MQKREPFTGFSEETGIFLGELSLHNYRSWFEEHREIYERAVKKPMDALAHDVTARLAEKFPDDPITVHVSRIYRDARRLFGRGPYKENMWLAIKPFTDRADGVCFFFEIRPFQCEAGLGFWGETPAVAASLRHYIDSHEKEFLGHRALIEGQEYFKFSFEPYARPKGHADDGLSPFYNSKSFSLFHEEPYGELTYSAELTEFLTEKFSGFMPLYRDLVKASVT